MTGSRWRRAQNILLNRQCARRVTRSGCHPNFGRGLNQAEYLTPPYTALPNEAQTFPAPPKIPTEREISMPELTPMKKQYLEIKAQHPDCLLFFRLGDFYEMFDEDAKVAAEELNLTLTTRDRNKPLEERTPMCGVPYHLPRPTSPG